MGTPALPLAGVLACADRRLYIGKRAGGGCVVSANDRFVPVGAADATAT